MFLGEASAREREKEREKERERERERERVLNKLIQTGYHRTKPNR